MEIARTLNYALIVLFFICYSYQIIYIPIALFVKRKNTVAEKKNRYAILIAAKNEENVIGNLIKSLKQQKYPQDMIDIFVAADNCDDKTAEVAFKHGATVFERFDSAHCGKGFVLEFLLEQIKTQSKRDYDAYLVFDADNVVDPNFVSEINKTFSQGYEIVTCYRNSKNYGDNWISAGYALWFLREAQYLNGARYKIGSSAGVSGTGFMFSDKVLKKCGGWHFFSLTEDIEFTIHNIISGVKIGYCENAVLYDEQPVSFSQSWKQRKRWAKGYWQVLSMYGKSLLAGIFKGKFSCFDMAMSIMPATILTTIGIIINLYILATNIFIASGTDKVLLSLFQSVGSLYITLFFLGLITTVTEWKRIYCSAFFKILYLFTFPIFMLTYIPICISSFFTKVEWSRIEHTKNVEISEFLPDEISKKCPY